MKNNFNRLAFSTAGSTSNGITTNNSSINDSSRNDSSRNDSSRNDSSRNDSSRNDSSRNDSSRNDSSRNDSSRNDSILQFAASSSAASSTSSSSSSSSSSMAKSGGHMGGPMGHMGGGEKPKDLKKALKQLTGFAGKYLSFIIVACVCAVVSSVFTIIGPDKLSDMTNLITKGLFPGAALDLDGITKIAFTLVIFYGISVVASLIQGLSMTTANQGISKNLRTSISLKIKRLPMMYFNKMTTGDVLSRVTNDVDMISDTLQRSVAQLISAVVMLFGVIFMMFKTNWIMALTAIVSSLIGFSLMIVIMAKSQKYFTARQKWLGQINGHIEEVYSGHDIVKTYNGEKSERAKFDVMNAKLYESNWKSQFLSGLMMPIMGFIGNLGFVSVCVVGAALTMKDVITFGTIVAFMLYVRLFSNPLSQLAQAFTSLQSTAAASERVFEFLNAEEMPDESDKPDFQGTVSGEVDFSHVRFGYNPESPVIHDFSEHIVPGSKIAIVGPTGAGKTTLVSLLMRFFNVDSGTISIDGVSTSSIPGSSVHSMFGMVLQDTWLFEGTIRENIVYCKSSVTDEQVENACRAVGLHHYIKSLPDGYDTVLTDSISLSAGQKQLLTIARAMIQDAPMLILDEATSSVDTRTEELIQKAMDNLTHGRTSFVIAHRLSTIRNADKILVLKDGDIIESGDHSSLMAAGGFYADLYNSQFEKVS